MPAVDPLIGVKVGSYQVAQKLGEGGMGVVYQARHITLDRLVAIKFLAGQLTTNKSYVERFLREARRCKAESSPHHYGA